ncbi:glycogen synthase GlgA [Methylomarinum sp. Ch1-1]|uniref:Glycogen synthase n=1 Tax=Methylomarinum roseum TaxID=3067653 RepID=A0AAU7NTV8_9GAMM|nr:glycogen synthase GlgA [Methylomarinum sp. Ch1-1]MDP4519495.1 glycogen synthase GlgA [Methylomarinum sp. Ch1-1]
MKKILFVTSEAHPLIKTGGLADVAGSLPKALAKLGQGPIIDATTETESEPATEHGQDIRLIMPNYQDIQHVEKPRYICTLRVDNRDVNILETHLPDSDVIAWLVDYRPFFDYPGNPYVDDHGNPWHNIAERFALFCRLATEVAMNRAHLDWTPDIVHCNDWQSGLVPALLSLESKAPATVFTIHNMAYQGVFPGAIFSALNLPGQLWHPDGLEYHGMLSFIKGGLVYSDRITTVSPTYAQEIQTPEFGYGLEGLLSHRHTILSGILNGMDLEQWDPSSDEHIVSNYTARTIKQKLPNKTALQQRMSLPVDENIPVFGLISRLVEQKGIDLVLACLPHLVKQPLQIVLLGSGDKSIELKVKNFAHLYPDKIAVTIGYDEQLAHQIEAGADIFLMPSRFEPCGLNQMYSQRYGTIPIVRKTGGLADTIEDALPHSIAAGSATGISFNDASAGALLEAIKRAQILFENKQAWRKIQQSAMKKDFSWENSANQYLALYDAISDA